MAIIHQSSVGHRIFVATLLANCLLVGLTVFFLARSYELVEEASQRSTENLAHLLSKDIGNDYRAYDLALQTVADELSGHHPPATVADRDLLFARVNQAPRMVGVLRLADAKGNVVYSPDLTGRPPVNISDRTYFQRLRDDPNAGLQISEPLTGRATGKTVLVLARRVGNPDGSFAGVVFASYPTEAIAQKIDDLTLGANDAVVVRTPDLGMILRYPQQDSAANLPNSRFLTPEFRAALSISPQRGQYRTESSTPDRIDRIFSYQRNDEYRFYVNVGAVRGSALLPWRLESAAVGSIVLVFTLLTSFLAWRLRRAWIRNARNEARFQSFFTSTLVGMAVTSPEKGTLIVNPALCEITGYSEVELKETNWVELTHPDDRAADIDNYQRMLAGEIDGYSIEKRFVRADRQVRHALITVRAVHKPDGQIDFVASSVQDITSRVVAEQALADVASKLEEAVELMDAAGDVARVGGWSIALPSRTLTWTTETYRIHGIPPGTPITIDAIVGFYSPDSRPLIEATLSAAIENGTPWDIELQLMTATGRQIWTRAIGRAERKGGQVVRLFGALIDIDERHRLEAALRQNDDTLRTILETTGDGYWKIGAGGRLQDVNPAYCRHSGYTREELLELSIADLEVVESSAEIEFTRQRILNAGKRLFETRHRRKDGSTWQVEVSVSGGANHNSYVFLRDITGRKTLEEKVLNSREQLRQFLDHLPAMAYVKDADSRLLVANMGFKTLLGLDPRAMIGQRSDEIFSGEFGQKTAADERRILATGRTEILEEVFGEKFFESTKFVIRLPDRRLLGGITLDVTARTKNRLRVEALLALAEHGGTMEERELLRFGLEKAESLTGSSIGFLHFVNDDQESIELVTWTAGALRGCQATYDNHYPISQAGIWADCFRLQHAVTFNDYAGYAAKQGLPPGHTHMDRLSSVPVIEEGKVRMIMGVGNKTTDYDDFDIESVQLIGNDLWRIVRRKRLENSLRIQLEEITSLNRKLSQAQNQLLQSEKMSTIGQLAAGVAHELNNPIGFVQSNLGTLEGYVDDLMDVLEFTQHCAEHCPLPNRIEELMKLREERDIDFLKTDIKQLLAESKDGADRVRRIVQNLKDFSHVSEDEWLWTDLHSGLDSTLNLVWNEVKYKAEVEKHYGRLPQVHCVASQINQVFMNLLVNAAQAIEGHGKITLSSGTNTDENGQNISVWVEIRDTGKGIPAENLTRIFDPFFTTKPVGKGTGLGLSLAWSIIEKHHGILAVDSVVNQGTAFRITLPVEGNNDSSGNGHE